MTDSMGLLRDEQSPLIGVLGGTFDPVHYGHLRAALEILQAVKLREIRFVPAAIPPHREGPRETALNRTEMVARAIADQPGFVLDRRELNRPGPSYTVDTLRSMRREWGMESRICLIVGADAFQSLPQWRAPMDILELAHVIVANRPGSPIDIQESQQPLIAGRITEDIQELRTIPSGRIWFQDVTPLAISATSLRTQITHGRSIRYLLPDTVWEFIKNHQLYGYHAGGNGFGTQK